MKVVIKRVGREDAVKVSVPEDRAELTVEESRIEFDRVVKIEVPSEETGTIIVTPPAVLYAKVINVAGRATVKVVATGREVEEMIKPSRPPKGEIMKRVFDVLGPREQAKSAKEIADLTGFDIRRVYRMAWILKERGLIETLVKNGRKYYYRTGIEVKPREEQRNLDVMIVE